MLRGFLLLAIALTYGIWWWRKNYKPSVLEQHFSDLEMKQKVGNIAQASSYLAPPPLCMFAEGWGTTARINPTNPMYNRPGPTRFNMRFAQPTSSS